MPSPLVAAAAAAGLIAVVGGLSMLHGGQPAVPTVTPEEGTGIASAELLDDLAVLEALEILEDEDLDVLEDLDDVDDETLEVLGG